MNNEELLPGLGSDRNSEKKYLMTRSQLDQLFRLLTDDDMETVKADETEEGIYQYLTDREIMRELDNKFDDVNDPDVKVRLELLWDIVKQVASDDVAITCPIRRVNRKPANSKIVLRK
jgi:hypothetical protein